MDETDVIAAKRFTGVEEPSATHRAPAGYTEQAMKSSRSDLEVVNTHLGGGLVKILSLCELQLSSWGFLPGFFFLNHYGSKL